VKRLPELRRIGITPVGVVLLLRTVFAGSYAQAHQEHRHHAQAVLLGSERAALAKIAGPPRPGDRAPGLGGRDLSRRRQQRLGFGPDPLPPVVAPGHR
jgi:hypothetical protein